MGNLHAKERKHPQVKSIVDKVWERFASTSESQKLGLQDLYCAVLLVYNNEEKRYYEWTNKSTSILVNAKIILAMQQLFERRLCDINKTVPGPFNDPPTREEVEELLKTSDKNQDGMLDRDEFSTFIETFTKNVSARISTNILLFSFVIPTIVVLSRPGAEQLPVVGPIVRRAPNPLYSAVMTTLIVFAGSQLRKI